MPPALMLLMQLSTFSLPPFPSGNQSPQTVIADSNPTRLFFGPTGRALGKGEAYFGAYESLLPFFQVGLTDRISIGGGALPLFFAGSQTPFWLTPKVQVAKTDFLQASVGVLHVANLPGHNFGIAYGVATIGEADSAFTFGGGYAYTRGDEHEDHGGAPVMMLGLERRISNRTKVITENYFFGDGGIVSGGIRFLGDKLTVDIGLFSPLGAGAFFAGPVVNFVRKF